jgi:hypothetical protein
MKQCGAKTAAIVSLIGELRQGVPLRTWLELPILPHAAQLFVEHTFSVIESGNLCAIATAFNYGQYDLRSCVTKSLQATR